MTDGHLGRRVAELIGWGAVACLGLVMISQAVGWDGSRLVTTVQSLTPYGIPVAAVVAAVAVWNDSHRLAVGAATVGLATLALATPLVFPASQPDSEEGATGVRFVSVNLLFSNSDVADLADELIDRDADVVTFSEYTREHQKTLLDHPLVDRYAYRIDNDGRRAGGLAIWSKFPVSENDPSDPIHRTIDATLDGPDGSLRLLAVHPPTPLIDHDGWARSLRRIRETADDGRDSTLIIGDFNASYWHPVFRDFLRQGMTDAHIAHDRGWSTSWPTDQPVPPFVRLDHALTGAGLVSTDVHDFRLPGSDHVAFVVTVKPAAS